MALLWGSKYVYVWMQFTRVTGKAGKCNFFASVKCDAAATGRFSDSVTRVGYMSVGHGQTEQQAFEEYKRCLLTVAEQSGFNNNKVICITRKDYQAMLRTWLLEQEVFEDEFYSPAYEGARR